MNWAADVTHAALPAAPDEPCAAPELAAGEPCAAPELAADEPAAPDEPCAPPGVASPPPAEPGAVVADGDRLALEDRDGGVEPAGALAVACGAGILAVTALTITIAPGADGVALSAAGPLLHAASVVIAHMPRKNARDLRG